MTNKNLFPIALMSILGMAAAALPEYRSFHITFGSRDDGKKIKKEEAQIVDEICAVVGYAAGFNGVLDDSKWLVKAEHKAEADPDRRGLAQEELSLLPHEYEMLEILEKQTDEDQANRKLACWNACPPSDCRTFYALGIELGACCGCCYTACGGERRSLYERELNEDLATFMKNKASELCHGAAPSGKIDHVDCNDVSVNLVRSDE